MEKITPMSFKKFERKWYLVDLSGKVLGRAASRISMILMGKRKPLYSPHLDVGDFVVAINAEKIKVTGKKLKDKIYYHHSGYPGGIKAQKMKELLNKNPEKIIKLAVKRMLPKNKLGKKLIKRLKVYSGPNHPHMAQKPEPIEIEKIK
ncbi:MAG: 50S ribosomal protein L13 [Candidatus Hydrothermales bacterium]